VTTSAQQVTDPYMATYRRVPPTGPGVCSICHTGAAGSSANCNSCDLTRSQVTFPAKFILPISLYEVPDQYWNILRYYKDGDRSQVRSQLGTVLAATIARFGAAHWDCIVREFGGAPTLVTTVPSSAGRQGEHPLSRAVRRSMSLKDLFTDTLVSGTAAIGHRRANDDGFRAVKRLDGHRVLLVEDTFTTGGRTQSAASALRLAGATSVGVLAAGRVINPSWDENCQRVWSYAKGGFTFEACCLCTRVPLPQQPA
jgi:predicted amidophosphoribosyltransferase